MTLHCRDSTGYPGEEYKIKLQKSLNCTQTAVSIHFGSGQCKVIVNVYTMILFNMKFEKVYITSIQKTKQD